MVFVELVKFLERECFICASGNRLLRNSPFETYRGFNHAREEFEEMNYAYAENKSRPKYSKYINESRNNRTRPTVF